MTADTLNRPFRNFKPFFTSHGYALVTTDVRGTGASFGVWPQPWDRESVLDGGEIVDWIVAQPWSNGRVAGTGISYVGTTAELLAVPNRPAVQAILALFNHPDSYTDISYPGGILNQRFVAAWSDLSLDMDCNRIPAQYGRAHSAAMLVRGVQPVDGDAGRTMLDQAIAEHSANGAAFKYVREVTCRDDVAPGTDLEIEDVTVHRFAPEIAQAAVPIGGWASWMDAGTGDAALRRFMTFDNAGWAVIGAWEHGGRFNADPYIAGKAKVNPALPQQWLEQMRFYDAYLQDQDNGVRGTEDARITTHWAKVYGAKPACGHRKACSRTLVHGCRSHPLAAGAGR